MERVFEKFAELFTERCRVIPLLDLSEDSIRYDFFISLTKIKKLKPSDLQIEYKIDRRSYVLRNNINSRRKEKPLMDLVVDKSNLKLCFEFGLFKQNSNEEGTINKTARTVKMMNDIIRLGIDSFFTKRKAYFICIADDKMLGHQLQSKIIGKFPSDYLISMDVVKKQMEKQTSDFDERFIKKFEELNCSFKAKLIFNRQIEAKKINRETRILVWEVKKYNN